MEKYRIVTNGYTYVVQEYRRGFLNWRLSWKSHKYDPYCMGLYETAEFATKGLAIEFKRELELYDAEQLANDWNVVE